ncbi:MAG TPA: hypothetical protein VMU61_02630, partial [Candidatus Aquilonibacter sp.]|nr:hypothetical protein [Candidatus Aquilonibacter sp.]
ARRAIELDCGTERVGETVASYGYVPDPYVDAGHLCIEYVVRHHGQRGRDRRDTELKSRRRWGTDGSGGSASLDNGINCTL